MIKQKISSSILKQEPGPNSLFSVYSALSVVYLSLTTEILDDTEMRAKTTEPCCLSWTPAT